MIKRLAAIVAGALALSALPAYAATTTCSTVAACVFGSNTSSGIGVEGSSKTGAGVDGTSTSSFGVSGVSSSSHGVNGTSASSFGVVGVTTQNATSASTARSGVLGEDESTNKKSYNIGVAGTSKYGIGVSGTGGTYGGYFNTVFSSSYDADPDGFIAAGFGSSDGAINAYGKFNDEGPHQYPPDVLFSGIGCSIAVNSSQYGCSTSVSIDADGTAYFAGSVTTNTSDEVRTKTTYGSDVASFGARVTAPTIEDLGKAEVQHGSAYVALEPIFASTIDAAAGYMVFITPEGDSHGLYTTQLTPHGFAVRENDGGKSSLTFDYRIVAHPADTKKARLAAMPRITRLLRTSRRNF